VVAIRLSAYTGRCAAIHPVAETMAAATSPPFRSAWAVTSANIRSESVSPRTSARAAPSSASSPGRSPSAPLWAISRPDIANGCVFATVRPPVEAWRTWVMNVADVALRASRAKAGSSKAAIGCLSSTADPSAAK
jgi:hypothetical protein